MSKKPKQDDSAIDLDTSEDSPVAEIPEPVGPSPIPPPAEEIAITSGTLNSAGMRQIVRGGGAVTFDGRHIDRVEDVPSDAHMAEIRAIRKCQIDSL